MSSRGAGSRRVLELELQHVAEAPSPRNAQMPVPPNGVLQPQQRRHADSVVEPGRLDLFQVEDVRGTRGLLHLLRECATCQLTDWAT